MTADHYAPAPFYAELVEHGLILPTDVPGTYGRGARFDDILERLDALVLADPLNRGAEPLTFPPVIARKMLEKLGYLENFPHLIGSIHSFFGDEATARDMAARAQRGERWEDLLDITALMMLPAACYPVYPLFTGLLAQGGRLVTTRNWCFRHEPSDEPTRLQSFRMREFVRAGSPEVVAAWRQEWLAHSLDLLASLGLPVTSDVATDPFFGRMGKMLAAGQRDQELKFELLVPVISETAPTAIASFNWHQDHFSGKFGFRDANGATAHTACMAFGLDRITLALLKTHGVDSAAWPEAVRQRLGMGCTDR